LKVLAARSIRRTGRAWTSLASSGRSSSGRSRSTSARVKCGRRFRAQAIWQCLLRSADCLSQGDFRPAETHRNPGGDQLQQELAGVTTIVRQVIGKLDADAPLFCHDPHLKWRRTCRKAVPVHRQPMSLGKVEEHSRIATCGNDPPGRRISLSRCSSRYSCPVTHCTRSFRYRT